MPATLTIIDGLQGDLEHEIYITFRYSITLFACVPVHSVQSYMPLVKFVLLWYTFCATQITSAELLALTLLQIYVSGVLITFSDSL